MVWCAAAAAAGGGSGGSGGDSGGGDHGGGGVCVHVGVRACAPACMHAYMWRPEVNAHAGFLPLSLSVLNSFMST